MIPDPPTAPPTDTACPSCGGPLLPRHPAGIVHQHADLACPVLAADDARRVQVADATRRPHHAPNVRPLN